MPPTIHVQPEVLHQVARTAWQHSLHFADTAQELQVNGSRLEMAWQGGSAEEYLWELQQLVRNLKAQSEQLDQLGLILSHQAENWQEKDQHWAGEYQSILLA